MPPVLITCPASGALVPTGAQAQSLAQLDIDGYLLIACPECGRDHEWTPLDAQLAVERSAVLP